MLSVSLIMTTFNSRESFVQSYKSIQQQTWPYIEVVVVDGASTDGTREEIEKSKFELTHKNKRKCLKNKEKEEKETRKK